MGNKVLGYTSDVELDMLSVTFPINISKKKRSVRVEPNLTVDDIVNLKTKTLTKRILLGVTNGFWEVKVMLVQQMADIRDEQLTVAPPWTQVALDFAGPITVKGQVNKRAKMKVWILV